MWSSLSDRDKRLLLITLVVFVIGIGYIGLTLLSRRVETAPVSEATSRRFEDLFAKMSNVEALKSRNAILRKKIGNEEGAFVNVKEVSKLIDTLVQLGGQSGVRIKGYNPTINERSRPFASLELKVSLEGPFEQVISFLDNVRKAKYILLPTNIKAGLKDANNPDLEVQVTLLTYLMGVQPKPAAPVATTEIAGVAP